MGADAGVGVGAMEATGAAQGVQSRQAFCGTDGMVSIDITGSGHMVVRVRDAASHEIWSAETIETGNTNTTEVVHGAAGAWTLELDPGSGYTGHYFARLRC